jgi:hypothetical protein
MAPEATRARPVGQNIPPERGRSLGKKFTVDNAACFYIVLRILATPPDVIPLRTRRNDQDTQSLEDV